MLPSAGALPATIVAGPGLRAVGAGAGRHGSMSPLRILHLVTRSQRRGAEVVALELARQLDALGHDDRVVALVPGFDGAVEPELPPLRRRPNVGIVASLPLRRALRRELDRRPVDLVLAHGGRPFEIAVLARHRAKPVVVWQRILPFPEVVWSPLRRAWWRRLARAGDGAVVLTNELESELLRLGFRGPIWKIQNFRDSGPFVGLDRRVAAAALRAELAIAPDTGVIGLVGHLIEQKRPDRALDVLAGVHARGEPAHLVVAGDGPLRERFERDASAKGLASFVHLLGERRDVDVVLGGIDLLVSTSQAEGVPGVLIEALMAGCPVVAMRVGGVAAVVEDRATGILVGAGDVTAMTERVVELLRDAALRERLGAAARRRSDDFSAQRAAREYAARFEELLGRAEPDADVAPS
jgi:glycosyltransferase involved in cell wall biosynthesis